MATIFPGMDPYIEATGKWEDFHNKIIGDMERFLASVLPPRYVVRVGERSYIQFAEPSETMAAQLSFKPDIGIKTEGNASAGVAVASTLEEAAVDMAGLVEEETRETYLEIRELSAQERLVTGIEVLSPSNKRPGTVGWYQYERKRRAFMEGHAHLVEIDLLRGGQRMAMAGAWPDCPYYMLVVRRELAPRCKVWPAHYLHPLPAIPIPLAAPDPDIPLTLQPLVEGIYERSRYRQSIDYGRPLRPPLPADEAAWLAERVERDLHSGQAP